jgi:hypothetical protein
MAQIQYVAPLLTALRLPLRGSDSAFMQQPQWNLLQRSAMLIGGAAWQRPHV